jgi:hypothetical protein
MNRAHGRDRDGGCIFHQNISKTGHKSFERSPSKSVFKYKSKIYESQPADRRIFAEPNTGGRTAVVLGGIGRRKQRRELRQ